MHTVCLCVLVSVCVNVLIFGQLSKFVAGKLLLVCMDDGLAIITLSPGACQDSPAPVHRIEAGMDG